MLSNNYSIQIHVHQRNCIIICVFCFHNLIFKTNQIIVDIAWSYSSATHNAILCGCVPIHDSMWLQFPHINQGVGKVQLSLFQTWLWIWCKPVSQRSNSHDDAIKWKDFPRYWSFMRGIHWSPVNSPHTNASDAELWCFLSSMPEWTAE